MPQSRTRASMNPTRRVRLGVTEVPRRVDAGWRRLRAVAIEAHAREAGRHSGRGPPTVRQGEHVRRIVGPPRPSRQTAFPDGWRDGRSHLLIGAGLKHKVRFSDAAGPSGRS